MTVSRFWRQSRDTQARPHERVRVEHANIIVIAGLQMTTLIQSTRLQLSLLQFETAVHDKVITNEDSGMTLTRRWCRARALRSLPGHDLQVQNVDIVEVVLAILTSKNVHLCSANYVCGVIKASWRSTSAAWALVPCHSDGIESMQVFVSDSTFSLASKYDDS